jgi:hypothetical protein
MNNVRHPMVAFSKIATQSHVVFQKCRIFSRTEEMGEGFDDKKRLSSSRAIRFCLEIK